jgi:hypothetical protein
MTHHTTLPAVRSVSMAFILLAAATGLMWPKSNIQAEDTRAEDVIEPVPVRTLSYRSPMQPNDEPPVYPAWTIRDGMWIPWTMQPPAWWTAIAGTYVVAEAVPTPPERPGPNRTEPDQTSSVPMQKRMARTPDLCERHGLKKTYTDRYRWRCRP